MMKAIFTLAVLLLTGCSGAPYVVEPAHEANPVRSYSISVVSHGWHTGLIVPGTVLNAVVPALQSRFGQPAYYEVSWGDMGFYQAQKVTSDLTVQAMFWSQGAVLHIVSVEEAPERYFAGEPLITTCLSENELQSLGAFLEGSFAHSPEGSVIEMRQGIYGDSEFYDGEGRYYLLNTCNKWTAKALRSAGFDVSPWVKLTAGSVMRFLEQHPRVCR